MMWIWGLHHGRKTRPYIKKTMFNFLCEPNLSKHGQCGPYVNGVEMSHGLGGDRVGTMWRPCDYMTSFNWRKLLTNINFDAGFR